MFGKQLVTSMINRSSENGADRRAFLRTAGLGLASAGVLGVAGASAASATDGHGHPAPPTTEAGEPITDGSILNFALNLEYLEAEFYSYAAFGYGLDTGDIDGNLPVGGVTGGSKVPFRNTLVRKAAEDIARDELAHVRFLRRELGAAKVSRPQIDLVGSFSAAAQAAGLVGPGQPFNPFADDDSFLIGAFLFEDVGVTAYKGAAPLILNKTYLEAAAGILAFEAYHAATIRSAMAVRGISAAADAVSDARDSLDGTSDVDQGINAGDGSGIVAPGDGDAIAYSRSPGQVLNVVYLNPAATDRGGFFPAGVNGEIRSSAASA